MCSHPGNRALAERLEVLEDSWGLGSELAELCFYHFLLPASQEAGPGSRVPLVGVTAKLCGKGYAKEGKRFGAVSVVNLLQALGWVLYILHLT